MKREKSMWRIGLALALVLMAFSALGGGVIARDAFDDDYDDCPSHSRVDAIENLRVVRGAESDELSVSWDRIDIPSLGIGRNRFTAQITVIAEGPGDDKETRREPLGETKTKFDGITGASDWDVSAALTDGDYVISHIVKHDFTSGLDKPKLFDFFYYVPDAGDLDDSKYLKGSRRELQWSQALEDNKIKEHDKGTFYYLGFNHNFDNYYVNNGMTNPVSPKFRIGLVHKLGIDPDDADFDHFRIEVQDDSGDDVLGFQAATVSDSSAYGDDTVIVFGSVGMGTAANTQYDMSDVDQGIYDGDKPFSNIKTANTIDADEGGRLDAVYDSSDLLWRQYFNAAGDENDNGPQVYGQAPKIWEGNTMLTLSLPSATPVNVDLFMTNAYVAIPHLVYSLAVSGGTELRQNLSYANLMPAYMLGERGRSTGIPPDVLEDNDDLPAYRQNGGVRRLFARTPDEYYDVSPSALSDDGSYTITVWAENDDDEVISPTATLTFNLQNEKETSNLASNLVCFSDTDNTNQYGPRSLALPVTAVTNAGSNLPLLLALVNPLAEGLCSSRIPDVTRSQIRSLIQDDPAGLPAASSSKTSNPIGHQGRIVGITIEEK